MKTSHIRIETSADLEENWKFQYTLKNFECFHITCSTMCLILYYLVLNVFGFILHLFCFPNVLHILSTAFHMAFQKFE